MGIHPDERDNDSNVSGISLLSGFVISLNSNNVTIPNAPINKEIAKNVNPRFCFRFTKIPKKN